MGRIADGFLQIVVLGGVFGSLPIFFHLPSAASGLEGFDAWFNSVVTAGAAIMLNLPAIIYLRVSDRRHGYLSWGRRIWRFIGYLTGMLVRLAPGAVLAWFIFFMGVGYGAGGETEEALVLFGMAAGVIVLFGFWAAYWGSKVRPVFGTSGR